jgi:diguanylate cyclase (GGDEF)-like protein/PAS domain S-box-containing protein
MLVAIERVRAPGSRIIDAMNTPPRLLSDCPSDGRGGGARPEAAMDESILDAAARVLLPRRGDTPRTLRPRRGFVAAGTAALAIGLVVSCFPLSALPADALWRLAGGILAAILAFYAAFRTGLGLRAQASESRLAQAQRIARLGCWSFDPKGKEVFWSEETYRIFGVDPARPVPAGDAFMRLLHPEDRLHYRDLIRPARDEGRGFDSEYRIVLPGGEVRWLHVIGEPVAGDDGRTALLRGTVMDVTARKGQEQALVQARDEAAAAQATLVDAIEGLTESFALFDADDRLVLCNSRYATTFTDFGSFGAIAGWSFEALVRASLARGEVIPPEFANNAEGWVADRIRRHRNPGPEPHEIEVQGGRWLQVSERHTKSGGIVGVRIDITERKQFEQRQTMEHAVTRLLADAETVGEAMPRVIRTICETLGWDCGAHWQLDKRGQVLRCAAAWSIDASAVREYTAYSSGQNFVPSPAGLIRRVWTTGRSVWIADVASDPGFQRAPAALKAGLHGAFAFPVTIGAEIAGVMEFYVRNVRQPDQRLLGILESLGLQIGQFIARKAAQGQLQQLAHFDFLTGLPNRNLFNQILTHAFAKAQRNATPLGVLFIDLDGFKQINDRFGHDAGDHLLVTFTQRLRQCLRKSDTIALHAGAGTAARLGGDEFVVLVDVVSDPSELAAVAKRILAVAAEPFDLAGPSGHVTASIGISVYPHDGREIDDLIKAADNAMYEAKQAGKNAFRFYSPATPRLVSVQ